LKAPFRLREGASAADVDAALAVLAATHRQASAPGLSVAILGGFVALRPAGPAPEIDALASACVTELDIFRASMTDAELTARRAAGLDPTEDDHLIRWGYPYVLDRFNFHVTLTRALPSDEAQSARAALSAHFAPAIAPRFAIDALCLFGDPGGGRAFRLLRRHALSSR
jgi:hypothetical protein